jgi:hypothetical protein
MFHKYGVHLGLCFSEPLLRLQDATVVLSDMGEDPSCSLSPLQHQDGRLTRTLLPVSLA